MHVTRIQQHAKSLRVNIFARNCPRWPPPTFQGLCPSFSRPLPLLFEASAHPIQGLWNKTRPRPDKRSPLNLFWDGNVVPPCQVSPAGHPPDLCLSMSRSHSPHRWLQARQRRKSLPRQDLFADRKQETSPAKLSS